jgi:hypothetical protein
VVSGLPSVPDAYDEYVYWVDRMNFAPFHEPFGGWYGITMAYRQAREAWINAEWQVNCASWRWVSTGSLVDLADGDEAMVWATMVLAERWKFSARSRRVPRKTLMVRDKGVVV